LIKVVSLEKREIDSSYEQFLRSTNIPFHQQLLTVAFYSKRSVNVIKKVIYDKCHLVAVIESMYLKLEWLFLALKFYSHEKINA